jgi:Leucine-rich repeat (LRR) protein
MTEANTRLKPLRGETSRIFKLCLEKDIQTALQGLELAAALGSPLEGLLAEVAVDADGKLVRGKRFTSKDKTQAILDALLLQQLGIATRGSAEAKIRDSISTLECRLPILIDLSSFAKLKSLKITLSGAFKGADLTGLGPLSKLKSLTLTTGMVVFGDGGATLGSINGLIAPMLEEFDASFLDLADIDALSGCRKLKRVDIRGNRRLTSIENLKNSAVTLEDLDIGYCASVNSLKSLREATRLRYLDIGGVNQVTDLTDLKKLSALESIELSGCEGLTSFNGLPIAEIGDFVRENDIASNALYLNDLKALTSLKHMPPLAPHVRELHLNRTVALVDLSDLAASADSLRILHMDQVGISDLNDLTALVNLEILEITKCPELVDASGLAALEKLTSLRITGCKKLKSMPNAWKSPVQNLVLTGCSVLEPLKAIPAGIDAKTIEIDDRKLLPRAKPIKALKSDVGAIWKLLSSREISNVLMGLELSAALEPDALHTLMAEVKVKDGKLSRGKRFTGTGPAQPYLDLALFGLMSRAPAGSPLPKLRAQITELDLVLLSQAYPLDGFTALTRLSLHVGDDTTPDLTGFGPMPKLTHLKINGKRWGSSSAASLTSLSGLQAPALIEVDLSSSRVQEISALLLSPKITQLNLSDNPELADISGLEACAPRLETLNLNGCKQVISLEVLKNAQKLKSLDLGDCESLTSVLPLATCKSLEMIELERCRSLRSLEGISELGINPTTWYDGSTKFSLNGCSALTSLSYLPSFGGSLQSLSVDYTTALKTLDGLRNFPSLVEFKADHSGLKDIGNISALPALTSICLRHCDQLKDVTPLGQLVHLTDVDLTNSAVTTMPNGWRGSVKNLILKDCSALTSLGLLPAELVKLVCDESSNLSHIDGMQACHQLEVISVQSCPVLKDLGTPPASIREIDARGCMNLTSLKGLEGCPALTQVAISTSMLDMRALKGLPAVTISFDINELGKPTVKGQLVSLPESLIQAINSLPAVRLQIKGPSGSWYGSRHFDLYAFNQFKSVISLNFSEFDFHCKLEELVWLVHMEDLQSLVFYPRGNMSHILDGGVYDSIKKVKALQQNICKEAKIKPPTHLIS